MTLRHVLTGALLVAAILLVLAHQSRAARAAELPFWRVLIDKTAGENEWPIWGAVAAVGWSAILLQRTYWALALAGAAIALIARYLTAHPEVPRKRPALPDLDNTDGPAEPGSNVRLTNPDAQ